jgi:hypothetical protein
MCHCWRCSEFATICFELPLPVHTEAQKLQWRRTMKHATASILLLAIALPITATADSLPVRQCKAYVQGRIDVLDAELHKGEQPNVARKLLKRRDRLKDQLADCERNPKAYKKDI